MEPVDTVDVIVSGHLCLDLIPEMGRVPLEALTRTGRLAEVGALEFATGGAVSNTGTALHRLGVNVRLMASVGDDLIGQIILGLLENRDPVLSQMITRQPGLAGSYTVILSPQYVDRIFLHCTGTNNQFGVTNIDFSQLKGAKIFHLGYPPLLPRLTTNDGEELAAIYCQAKEQGILTSMDMAMPDPDGPSGQVNWLKVLDRTLPYTDIFVPSIEEIIFMVRRADYDAWKGQVLTHLTRRYLSDLADELIAMGPAIVGFKLSSKGLYLKSASAELVSRLNQLPLNAADWDNQEVFTPPFSVHVVGTTGAGDAAYAGLLAALLRGMNPEMAARWACAVAACNVEAADATSGLRTWEEIQSRLDKGWPLLEVTLPES